MFAVFGVEMSDPALIRFVHGAWLHPHARSLSTPHSSPSLDRECLDMGVEVIFSDSPDIARDTIDQWKRERQQAVPKQ
jgi:hypothetical protein